MKEKLVRFLGRRRAVVARDADLEVGGDDAAFDGVQLSHHVFRHHDRVGALPLGDRDGHRRTALAIRRSQDGSIVQARCSGSAAPTVTSATSLT